MRDVDNIVEIVDAIIPKSAKKIIFFCEVEEKASECSYYLFDESEEIRQCYELAEAGEIDTVSLDTTFSKMVEYVRRSAVYDAAMRNVVTVIIAGSSEKVIAEKYDKSVGLYKLKKEWKTKYLNK